MNKTVHDDGRIHGAVVGCRRADGRWLLIRRARGVRLSPLKICFPGGTIEPGEDHAAAARREFREELGVEVELVDHVWHHVCDDRPLTLWGYLGRLTSFEFAPCPHEVEEPLWLTPSEAATHPDGLPATAAFVEALVAAARRWG